MGEAVTTIEVVGEAGRIRINKSDLDLYRSQGYMTAEEHDLANPPAVGEEVTQEATDIDGAENGEGATETTQEAAPDPVVEHPAVEVAPVVPAAPKPVARKAAPKAAAPK